jgi:iron complex outermembrane receptor protein
MEMFMKTNRGFKKKIMASAIASCAVLGAGAPLLVQAQGSDEFIEEVTVTGVRAALISAMETKRGASGVVDAIDAQDIGKFPDTNLAESLQRIPGVSIDREGGEGKYVTVRGFGPGFNVTTLNGRQLTSENINRDFEFDTLGSEMISGLVINKTGSALTDSGGIGAIVDIRTARPFDVGNRIAGSLQVNYETLSEESTPQASILVSQKFADDAFGVLFSYNHFERDSTVNRVTNNNWTRVEANSGSDLYPDETELRSNANPDGRLYLPQNHFIQQQNDRRTRDNANLVLQFAPSDNLTITADALYSDYELLRDQNMLVNWFGSRPGWRDVVADKNGTVTHFIADKREGEDCCVQATEFNSIKENRKSDTLVAGLNAEWKLSDNFTLIADAYRSESNYEDPMGYGNSQVTMGYRNRLTWDMDGGFIPYISGFEDGTGSVGYQPDADGQLTIPNKHYLDPSNLRPGYTIRNGRIVEDTIDQFKLEGVYDSNRDTGLVKASYGLSFKSREKAREQFTTQRGLTAAEAATVNAREPRAYAVPGSSLNCMFCGGEFFWTEITQPKVTVLDAGSDFLDGVSSGGPIHTKWLQFDHDEFRQIYEGHIGVPFTTELIPSESYAITEDITSVYTQLEFAGDLGNLPYYFVTGLRYEQTDLTISGNLASILSVETEGAEVLNPKLSAVTPTDLTSDYAMFLPNVNFKIDLTDNLVTRAAYSKTITRPTIGDLRPNLEFGNLKQRGPYPVRAGNPDLKPLESDNLDLSLEWYYGEGSYASAGLFYKQVDNFILDETTGQKLNGEDGNPIVDPSNGQVITFSVTKPSNVETADVQGLELAVQHMFGETGFGTVVNATFVSTNAEYDANTFDSSFALVGLSDSYNIVGFYETDKYQVRLAYNYRDQFLRAVVDSEPSYVEDYGQFDLSASYNLTENVTITFDGINITGEATRWHARYSNQFLLAEESGPRYSLGVRASF